jgi:GTPase
MSKKAIKYDHNKHSITNNNLGTVPDFPAEVEKVSAERELITDKAIVFCGGVDVGKSSFASVLSTNILDDGNGSARVHVANHNHEIESGKSSSVSTSTLKFPNGSTCTLIDTCGHSKYMHTTISGVSGLFPDFGCLIVSPLRQITDMTKQYMKMLISHNIPIMIIVTKIDMALKDSCDITDKQIKELCDTYKRKTNFINSYYKYHSYKRGEKLVKEHDLSNNTNDDPVPKFTIIDNETNQKRISFNETDLDDITEYFNFDMFRLAAVNEIIQGFKIASGRQNYVPVIYVSNVEGYGLDIVRQAMMYVEPRDLWNSSDENTNSIIRYFRTKLNLPRLGMDNIHIGSTFFIDNTYLVKGIGLVVSGINRGEKINIGDELYIGPINKEFLKIKVKSIHNDKRDSVESLNNHHRGCICIKGIKNDIKKNQIMRGTVLISEKDMIKNVGYRFESAVTIFTGNSCTLRSGYSPVIHSGTIRQTAKMIIPEEQLSEEEKKALLLLSKRELKEKSQCKLKSGDVATVSFKFRQRPEYVDPGSIFVFRSGDLHGIGIVISVLPLDNDPDAQPESLKKKFRKIRPSNRDAVAKRPERILVK